MRVELRSVEFIGDLVAQIRVEEMLDAMSRVVEVVTGDIEMVSHVALPEPVGTNELPGRGMAGHGKNRSNCRSLHQASSSQPPHGQFPRK